MPKTALAGILQTHADGAYARVATAAAAERERAAERMRDLIAPFMRGCKIGIFGGTGTRKTIIIKELINNIVLESGGYSIFTSVVEGARRQTI